MGLQGVHLFHLAAFHATGPLTKNTHFVVLDLFLTGSTNSRLGLQLFQVYWWSLESGNNCFTVCFGVFLRNLHLFVLFAKHVYDFLHHHNHIDWQLAPRASMALML